MLVYSAHGLRVGIVFFDEEPGEDRVDRLVFMHRTTPVEDADCEEYATLFLDLRKSTDELMSAFKKNTAYEIRRARDKDRLVCRTIDSDDPKVLDDFWHFFREFSLAMGYRTAGKSVRKSLARVSSVGRLDISAVADAEGEVLVYHAYVRGMKRVRLLHACSMHGTAEDKAARALLGRANRLLFWWDLVRFKEEGFATYDLGGWYAKDDDPQMLRVNKFKEGFGGQVVKTYTCHKGCTLKGKAALWVRRNLLLPMRRYLR